MCFSSIDGVVEVDVVLQSVDWASCGGILGVLCHAWPGVGAELCFCCVMNFVVQAMKWSCITLAIVWYAAFVCEVGWVWLLPCIVAMIVVMMIVVALWLSWLSCLVVVVVGMVVVVVVIVVVIMVVVVVVVSVGCVGWRLKVLNVLAIS